MEMKLRSSGNTYAPLEPPLSGMDSDAARYIRLGWGIVIAGIGGFLLWASLAPLDKGVPLSGTVTVATSRKAIQHQTGGTIEDILVKEGDVVETGTVLVRMNSVQVQAGAGTARVQYLAARAAEARLIAERDGKKAIVFPAELEKMKSDPVVANYVALQQHLFSSRLLGIQSELSAMDERISGLKMQTSGLQASRDNKKQQLEFLQEQLSGMRELASEGYVTRNRLLELERMHAELRGAISEDIGNIGRGQRQIAELKLRRIQRQQEYQKEVRSQMSDAQKEAEMLAHKLSGLDHDLANVLVRAPVDGTVVGLNVFTRGGVITPGFRMMDILPRDDPLMVEGRLPVHLIDKVHPDLPVELIFTAFNRNLTPHIPGIVSQVSADRFVDENTGEPYYRLHARVAPEGIKMIADLQVKPGMPVDLFVKTGERTMMSYVLKPILDHLKMAMTED